MQTGTSMEFFPRHFLKVVAIGTWVLQALMKFGGNPSLGCDDVINAVNTVTRFRNT